MKKILTQIIITLTILMSFNPSVFAVSIASPINNNFALAGTGPACQSLDAINAGDGCSNSSGLDNVITAIVDLLSIIIGVAAVIMIIVSGLRFISSGGDPARVSTAKSGMIYAIIGLVIAVLAQTIVHVVLNVANGHASLL